MPVEPMTLPNLKSVIGAEFRLSSLKSRSQRFQRLWHRTSFNSQALNPIPFLVEAADGRKFKLLRAGSANQGKINLLLYGYEAASRLDFVPRLIWHDRRNILMEYIEGESPDISSQCFAQQFGNCLGRLHDTDVGTLSAVFIKRRVELELGEVCRSGLLSAQSLERIRSRLDSILPRDLHTSLVYADLQEANFCIDNDGKLFFIDLGGFWRGRLTDEYLFGYKSSRPRIYSQLDQDIFTESYLNAGGRKNIFDLADLVSAIIDIRQAAYFTRRYQGIPLFLPGTREAFRQLAIQRVKRLLGFASGD